MPATAKEMKDRLPDVSRLSLIGAQEYHAVKAFPVSTGDFMRKTLKTMKSEVAEDLCSPKNLEIL